MVRPRVCRRPLRWHVRWDALWLLLIAILGGASSPGQAQAQGKQSRLRPDSADSLSSPLIDRLAAEGFDNLSVAANEDTALISYENRAFRYEIRALNEVAREARSVLEEGAAGTEIRHLTLLARYRAVPLAAVTVRANASPEASLAEPEQKTRSSGPSVSMKTSGTTTPLEDQPRAQSSFGTIDLVLHPQVLAQFGQYGNPIQSQINLAPVLTTTLRKGLEVSGQLIIPLHNELGWEGDYVRPGLFTLSHLARLPAATFLSLTAGHFTRDRYGLDVSSQSYFYNRQLSAGIHVGMTGAVQVPPHPWRYEPLDLLTMSLSTSYMYPYLDLRARLTYGRFLKRDVGWRLEVSRRFEEVDIGFFALRTALGWNAGFNFTIPLPPSKYTNGDWLRVRPARYFDWEYRYQGFSASGQRYETGTGTLHRRLHQWRSIPP